MIKVKIFVDHVAISKFLLEKKDLEENYFPKIKKIFSS